MVSSDGRELGWTSGGLRIVFTPGTLYEYEPCLPSGGAEPCYRGGREMLDDPRFDTRYRLVTFLGRDPYPIGEGLVGLR